MFFWPWVLVSKLVMWFPLIFLVRVFFFLVESVFQHLKKHLFVYIVDVLIQLFFSKTELFAPEIKPSIMFHN